VSTARIALVALLLLSATLLASQPDLPRAKVHPKPTSEQIARWVEQLGDDEFRIREEATRKLEEACLDAEAALRVARSSTDPEVVHRATDLLEQITPVSNPFRFTFHSLNHAQAIAKAKSEKKVVLIHFYADWCGPCKMLEQQTFSEEKVQQFLMDKTIAIKVDTDENAKLVKQYKVVGIPCMLFIDGEGKEVGRLVGCKPPEQFLEEAGKIVGLVLSPKD